MACYKLFTQTTLRSASSRVPSTIQMTESMWSGAKIRKSPLKMDLNSVLCKTRWASHRTCCSLQASRYKSVSRTCEQFVDQNQFQLPSSTKFLCIPCQQIYAVTRPSVHNDYNADEKDITKDENQDVYWIDSPDGKPSSFVGFIQIFSDKTATS